MKTVGAVGSSSAAFTGVFKGGQLFGVTNLVINGFASTVSALTIYNIDPFRVKAVDSETRALEIVQESRDYSINSENRLNTIEEETRTFMVPAETRLLKVQTRKLVEVAGNPLDRREG